MGDLFETMAKARALYVVGGLIILASTPGVFGLIGFVQNRNYGQAALFGVLVPVGYGQGTWLIWRAWRESD